MKKANISLDNKQIGLMVVEKMEFKKVDAVCDAIYYAFSSEDDSERDDDMDSKQYALFTIFLAMVGWTEKEYREETKKHQCTCPDCGGPMEPMDNADMFNDDEEITKLPEPNKPKNSKTN